jgi:uncharacterized membrane protein YcaP (DUF421 family)
MSIADVFGIHAPFLQIIYRTALVYLAVLVGMRMTGARQLGQMTPFDLVLILLIANAVQNAMVGPDVSIFGGLAAAATLLLVNRGVALATDRVPRLRNVVEGQTVILINDGKMLEEHIRHAGLSDDLVMQAVREHGFEHASDVRTAVLEVDGTVSIVPIETKPVRTRKRLRAMKPGGN